MTTSTNLKIAALYVACFERAPDKQGLEFWNQVAIDSGLTDEALMIQMAEGFARALKSAEVEAWFAGVERSSSRST